MQSSNNSIEVNIIAGSKVDLVPCSHNVQMTYKNEQSASTKARMSEREAIYMYLKSARKGLSHLMTEEQAMMNFIKGMAGTGDLSLPLAFYNAGLWTGVVCMIIVIIVNTYAMRILVMTSQKLCFIYKIPAADYGQTAELSMKYAFPGIKHHAKWGKIVVNTFLIINQVGLICIYFLFVSENLKEGADPNNQLPITAVTAILLVPMLLVCSIRHLKLLAYFTAFANIVLLTSFAIMFQYIFRDLPSWQRLPAFNSWATLPLFFGSAMFAYQGINTISAIESRTIRPQNIIKWNGVLNTSCVLVAVLYIAIGFYGYLKFGDKVMGAVTLNMPMEIPLYRVAKIMFAVSIFLTYPVQLYVPVSVAVRYIEQQYSTRRTRLIAEYATRYLLVTFSFVVATLLPHLGLIISFIGSFAAMAIALLFPGLIHFFVNYMPKRRNKAWYLHLVISIFLILFGIVGMATGSYASISGLIEAVQKGGYS